ncbi:hypothetical protein BBP40_001628 [Aspergillus hancockii]|nr:hypothetical protein BBP40_001628 [Aspergillus hancockii]
MRDIIYNLGPGKIKMQANSLDHHELDSLKQQAEEDADTTVTSPFAAADPSTSRSIPAKATFSTDQQNDTEIPASDSDPDNLQFRWLHVPINNMQTMRNLLTRLSMEADRRNQHHRPLANFFDRSWTEIAAGGGKVYMNRSEELFDYAGRAIIDKPQDDPGRQGRLALYMPYLTLGKIDWRDHKHRNMNDQTREKHNNQGEGLASSTPHQKSEIKNAFAGQYEAMIDRISRRIEHEPMTLDQYYYAALSDTGEGDNDQVISRYINDKLSSRRKILMVDQLWLWVVDEKTIITSTDQRFDEKEDYILQILLDNLVYGESKGHFERPTSVKSVTELILGITSSLFMQKSHTMYDDRPKGPLEVFRESIRDVTNIEIKLFNDFIDHLEAKHKQKAFDCQKSRERDPSYSSALLVRESSHNPYHVIFKETKLLNGIKGISIRVFTIVAIVLLPLSFLTSLFALDISNFPHPGDSVNYQGWWLFPILFGVAATVCIPSIYIAFQVNKIMEWGLTWKAAWSGRRTPPARPVAGSNDTSNVLMVDTPSREAKFYSVNIQQEFASWSQLSLRRWRSKSPPQTSPA